MHLAYKEQGGQGGQGLGFAVQSLELRSVLGLGSRVSFQESPQTLKPSTPKALKP